MANIIVKCQCGEEFTTTDKRLKDGRGKYCSKECKYKYRKRPKGLKYKVIKDNPTSFKKGQQPWNVGVPMEIGQREYLSNLHKGKRYSKSTEFKKGQYENEKNSKWKGDNVGYSALHTWIERKLGSPQLCSKCGKNSDTRYHWHNISGKYNRDLNDWVRLCVKCHLSLHAEIRKQLNLNI